MGTITEYTNGLIGKMPGIRISVLDCGTVSRISFIRVFVITDEEMLRYLIKKDLDSGQDFTFTFRIHSKYAIGETSIAINNKNLDLLIAVIKQHQNKNYDLLKSGS